MHKINLSKQWARLKLVDAKIIGNIFQILQSFNKQNRWHTLLFNNKKVKRTPCQKKTELEQITKISPFHLFYSFQTSKIMQSESKLWN